MARTDFPLAIVAALSMGGVFAADAPPAFTIHVSEYTNAIYSLDCRAGLRPCSRDAFLAPGNPDSHADPEPDAWRRLATAVSAAVEAPDIQTTAYPTPATLAVATSAREDLALAALAAQSREELRRRVRARLPLPESNRFLETVETARARRATAWPATAIRLDGLRTGFSVLRHRSGLDDEIARLRLFFSVPEAPALQVHLIGLPAGAAGSVASVQRDHAFVESRAADSPADRLTAVMHELSHYWYGAAPDAVHEQILAAVMEDGGPTAFASYNLFDEILATAIANGYIERRLVSADRFADYLALPESFYGDADIDAASKAALPLIEEYVGAARPLDREFATRLLEITNRALARHQADLRLQLRTSALVADETLLDAAVYSLRNTHQAAAVFSETLHGFHDEQVCALQRYPELSAVIMLDRSDLASIEWLADEATLGTLERYASEYQRFIYGWRRTPRSTIYFVVGDGVTETLRGFGQLLSTRQRFAGLAPDAIARNPATGTSIPERDE